MTDTTKGNNAFDSSNFILFLLRYWKPLATLSLIAAIVSAIASFMVREKYLSTVVMFPANSNSISKSLLTQDVTGKNDISGFGEEEQAEQMLQILNSDEIRWKIIEKYDLINHYRINNEEKYKLTKLYKMYESNITYKRTEFQSVRVDVLDFNPDTAAMIANDIAALLDSARNRMQQERARQGLHIVEEEFFKEVNYIQSMKDSLKMLGALGVHDYEKQIEMISQEYYKALANNNASGAKKLEEKMEILGKYGAVQTALSFQLEYETERLVLLRSKYEETKADANQNMTYKFIVNNAYPSEKKAYPIRWLIVVLSVLGTFLLSVLVLVVLENYKRYVQQANG